MLKVVWWAFYNSYRYSYILERFQNLYVGLLQNFFHQYICTASSNPKSMCPNTSYYLWLRVNSQIKLSLLNNKARTWAAIPCSLNQLAVFVFFQDLVLIVQVLTVHQLTLAITRSCRVTQKEFWICSSLSQLLWEVICEQRTALMLIPSSLV